MPKSFDVERITYQGIYDFMKAHPDITLSQLCTKICCPYDSFRNFLFSGIESHKITIRSIRMLVKYTGRSFEELFAPRTAPEKLKRKVCPVCGMEFETKAGKKKYCSDRCRQKRDYEQVKNWDEERKARFREQQRNYERKKAEERKKPQKTKYVYEKPERTLEKMTPNQLLNYGKLSYQKQVEAMRNQKRTG